MKGKTLSPTELVSTTSTRKESSPKELPVKRESYDKEDKEAAAAAFILHGTIREAAKALDFPEQTVYAWTRKAWWPKLVDTMRMRHQEFIEARMSHTLELVSDALVDRLENGDYVYNSTKDKVVRIPIKAKEMANILATVHDKLRVMRNQPTDLKATAVLNLSDLTQDFVKLAREYRVKEDKGAVIEHDGNSFREKE